MELTALLTRRKTSFSYAKDTVIPPIVLEEIKKAVSGKMCKVQVSFRAKTTERPLESTMRVYQKTERLSKQAGSLFMRMSPLLPPITLRRSTKGQLRGESAKPFFHTH